jgi:type I restriction enzyme S subunit
MSLTGTLGKTDYGYAVKVEEAGPFLLNQRVGKISPLESEITHSYLLYSVRSNSYMKQLYSLPSGTKQANLSNSDVLNISIAVPSTKSEQDDIGAYIVKKTKALDDLIMKSENAIELMQERRTALISAAVTGKIDVRDWTAPEEPVQKEEV